MKVKVVLFASPNEEDRATENVFLKGQPTTSQDCRGDIPEIPSHLFSPLQSNAMFLSELHFFWFCEFSHVHRHLLKHQSGRKCVSVAAALRAKQGP